MKQNNNPLHSLLIKPSGPDCNLACTYCFYRENPTFQGNNIHRMSSSTLEELTRQALEQSFGEFAFNWQGGEPTLMGLDFFQEAIELQQFYGRGRGITNSIQTNGLLIDQNWAEFLRKHNFLVGLSLDGPKQIHNAYRTTVSGDGSFEQVFDSGKLMLQEQVMVNALAVVNDVSVQHPNEIYDFFKHHGFRYMQFIPCVETDPSKPDKAAYFSVPPAAFGEFLCTTFDLWLADFHDGRPTTSVRMFDSLLYPYAGRIPPDCTFQRTCGGYLVVEHNGEVFPCDFYVQDTWSLGNISENRLVDMFNSRKHALFSELKQKLKKKCIGCSWLWLCRGGCTKDRFRTPEDKKISHFCVSYRKLFNHFDAQMKELAAAVQDE